MRAVAVAKPGGLDNLKLVERDTRPPGYGEIQVQVRASSLNFHDYVVALGMLPTDDGRTPMSDGAGVVTAVGEGVAEFAVGDDVLSCFFPAWHDGRPAFPATTSTVLPQRRSLCRRRASHACRRDWTTGKRQRSPAQASQPGVPSW